MLAGEINRLAELCWVGDVLCREVCWLGCSVTMSLWLFVQWIQVSFAVIMSEVSSYFSNELNIEM